MYRCANIKLTSLTMSSTLNSNCGIIENIECVGSDRGGSGDDYVGKYRCHGFVNWAYPRVLPFLTVFMQFLSPQKVS